MKVKISMALFIMVILGCQHKLKDNNVEYFHDGSKIESTYIFQTILPFFSTVNSVTVFFTDSLLIMEGDIIVGDLEKKEQKKFLPYNNKNRKWDKGIIPFVIEPNHPNMNEIFSAIETLNQNTNLTIIPRVNEVDYVFFAKSNGCSSWIGKQGQKQIINIGNCNKGSIMHEILHAVGFYHEQSRADRDQYITINWGNIKDNKKGNFKKYSDKNQLGIDIGEYDYSSIMHYSENAFSKNGGKTIELKYPPANSNSTIGNREFISKGDIQSINTVYPKKY
ncbi:MAG: M12 family metallopeptidase [Chitinophagales bacterium]|nr:M12 family metallopeptidase [Chitinophagales bacterium]